MKQSTATINAIMSVLKSKNVEYTIGGETPVSKYSDLFKAEVNAILCEGFQTEVIEMSDDAKKKYLGDEKKLKNYVTGLINNWVRKYPGFNCGVAYEPANPGSRTGSTDEQVKAMRQLLKLTNDPDSIAEIQKSIDARLEEIRPESKVEINVDALPEHLRHLVK